MSLPGSPASYSIAKCASYAAARRVLVVVCLLSLNLVGAEPAGTPRPLHILASFYPVYIATLNVAGGIPGVEVVNLTRPITGCLHDYQLSPQDMVTITKADVFVINGAGMEAFLVKARRQNPKLIEVEASAGIDLLKGAAEESNPHVWVSVSLAMRQVQNIAAGLALADPAHADRFQANAKAYLAQLAALRDRMVVALKDARSRDIITFHEAFPYFAKEFSLNIVAVVERDPGSEPSARELAQTVRLVREKGVKALFAEPQYSSKSAEVIARETGANVYLLDPVVTGPDTADAYLKAMEKNLAVLQQALR